MGQLTCPGALITTQNIIVVFSLNPSLPPHFASLNRRLCVLSLRYFVIIPLTIYFSSCIIWLTACQASASVIQHPTTTIFLETS